MASCADPIEAGTAQSKAARAARVEAVRLSEVIAHHPLQIGSEVGRLLSLDDVAQGLLPRL